MTANVRDLILAATAELTEAGVASPRVDAELIAAHVLDTERGRIYSYENFSDAQARSFNSFIDTRCSHVPVQYITGSAPFRYLDLEVGPGVLIPRPETELVAQHAIDLLKSMPEASVADLGSGSGAIALAIATETSASVTAVEMESSAFVWLKRNCSAIAPQVECIQADVVNALMERNSSFDLIVANPPYIGASADLPFEVSAFEPDSALFGGEQGIEVPTKFAQVALRLLKPAGIFICEHGENQGEALRAILSIGFTEIVTHTDFNDRPRWTSAVKVSA